MDFLVRANSANQPCKADILDNESVGFERNQLFQKFGQFPEFPLKDEYIHREECPYPAYAGVANHVTDIVEGEVFGAAAGVPMGNSEINGIGTVFDGRLEHFARSDREQKLWLV